MLHIESVTKVYPTGRVALSDLSLEVGNGVLGLLGPNGAGKSTLMGILAAELGFEAGRITLDDIDLRRAPGAWRARLGYMPQSFDLTPQLSGREFLERTAMMSGYSARAMRERIGEMLKRVRLHDAAQRDAADYSRGMKQRLAVAATFLCEPALVLLDEPTSGLDPEERIVFRELLTEFSPRRVVILSTHVVADVERCCSQVAIINAGRLLFMGPPSRLIETMKSGVWETAAQTDVIEEWSCSRRLVSLRNREGSPWARVLALDPPSPTAVKCQAGLEDAYLDLLSTVETVAEIPA